MFRGKMREMRSTRRETREPKTAQETDGSSGSLVPVGASQTEPAETDLVESKEQTPENKEKPQTKRGRPRKYPKKADDVIVVKKPEAGKRGRPRKYPLPGESTTPEKKDGKLADTPSKDEGDKRVPVAVTPTKEPQEPGPRRSARRRPTDGLAIEKHSEGKTELKPATQAASSKAPKKLPPEKRNSLPMAPPPHPSKKESAGKPVAMYLAEPTKTSVLPQLKVILSKDEIKHDGFYFVWDSKLFYTIGFRDSSGLTCSIKPAAYRLSYQIWRIDQTTGKETMLNEGYTNKPWNKHFFFFSVANFIRKGLYELRFNAEPTKGNPPVKQLIYSVVVQDGSATRNLKASRGTTASTSEKGDRKSNRKRGKPEPSSSHKQHKEPPLPPPKKTAKAEPQSEKEDFASKEDVPSPFSISVDLPEQLVQLLLVDWENITKKKMLVPVPRQPPVREIIQSFQKSNRLMDQMSKDIIDKVILCFNGLLGHILLYRFEREQYEATLSKHENVCPADIYGAEHLLRLLVSLPRMVGEVGPEKLTRPLSNSERRTTRQLLHPQMPDPALYLQHMESILNDLAEYLKSESSRIFAKEYTSPERTYSSEIPM